MEMIILVVLAAGAMFLLTSRQRKQQREQQDQLARLTPGQEVMTGSGMFGTIVDVDEETDTITIESTPGIQTRWLRAAVRKVIPPVDDATGDATSASIASGSSDDEDAQVEDIVVPDDLSGLADDGIDFSKESDTTQAADEAESTDEVDDDVEATAVDADDEKDGNSK